MAMLIDEQGKCAFCGMILEDWADQYDHDGLEFCSQECLEHGKAVMAEQKMTGKSLKARRLTAAREKIVYLGGCLWDAAYDADACDNEEKRRELGQLLRQLWLEAGSLEGLIARLMEAEGDAD